MTGGRLAQVLLAALVILVTVRTAAASTVVLVHPESPTATTAEAIVRVHGELVSAGFNVEVAALSPSDMLVALEQVAKTPGVDAVVAILGDTSPDSIALWVVDRVTGKTTIRRLPNPGASDRAAESLAIRALELLRASLLEITMTTDDRSQFPPPPAVTRLMKETLDPRAVARWSIEAGGNLLTSPGGSLANVEPLLRVSRRFGSYWLARLSVSGLGTRGKTDSAFGTALVDQEFAVVETGVRLRPNARIQPVFVVGAGTLRVQAEGRATWPYQGQTAQRWSFLASAGAGFSFWIAHRFGCAAELQAQLAQPYPSIRYFGVEISHVGRPNLLLAFSLLAWL